MTPRKNSDELLSFMNALPLNPGRAKPASQVFQRLSGRTPDCPPLADLLTEPSQLGELRAHQVSDHARGCEYCRPWFEGRTRSTPTASPTYAEQYRAAFPEGEKVTTHDKPAVPTLAQNVVTEPVPEGLDGLFRRGQVDVALALVRPYLSLFLCGVGLAPKLAQVFERYLSKNGHQVAGDEPVLTQWLEGFAKQVLQMNELPHEPTASDWASYFTRQLLEDYLNEEPPGNDAPMTDAFREEALRRRVRTPEALRDLAAEFDNSDALDAYCATLTERVDRDVHHLNGHFLRGAS